MPHHPSPAPSALHLSDGVFSRLAARAAGRDVIALHVGDTYRAPPASALDEALRQAKNPAGYRYAPVQGEPALLDAALRHLERRAGIAPPRALLQVVSGATSGLGVVVDALVSPGDAVLLPSPFWPLIRGTIQRRGAEPIEVPFYTHLGAPGFDPEAALEAAVIPRTVAVYVNTPHNPTGVVLDEGTLAAIGRVASRHNLWILCDEVYEDLWLGASAPPSAWARDDFRARAVAVHSVSKAYGLAGARVGFVHGPEAAVAAIRGVQTFTTYCAPRPMQHVAAAALREGADCLDASRQAYREASLRAAAALGVAPPAGGTFLLLDLRPHLREGEDSITFLERCLEAGVLLTPGSATGRDYDDWARLCFTVVEPSVLDEALRRLRPLFAATVAATPGASTPRLDWPALVAAAERTPEEEQAWWMSMECQWPFVESDRRQAAQQTLREAVDTMGLAALPSLRAAADATTGVVRARLVALLARLGPAATPHLHALAASEEASLRIAAQSGLQALERTRQEALEHLLHSDAPSPAALAAHLHGHHETVRAAVLDRLGRMGAAARSVLPLVLALVRDDSARVRRAVAEALPHIDIADAAVMAALKGLCTDPDPAVAATARAGLGDPA